LLTLENYNIPGASLTQLRLAATNRGVILSANPLQEGFSSMLNITGMVDTTGTPIPDYQLPLEVTNRVWTPIGGSELGFIPEALAVSTNGFDLLSGGIQQVDDYDEATFVGQQLEGDFDQVVRVHSVDPAGRGAKAGIMVRENLDIGIGRPVDPEDPTTMFSRYIELAVNAPTSAAGEAGFGGHQIFMRPSTGDPFLQSVTVTNDAAPQFTNAWLRVQRLGEEFRMYRGTNGTSWEQIGSATFPEPAPTNVWVGIAFSPQNDDLFSGSGLRNLFTAKFRDYAVTNAPIAKLKIEKLATPSQARLSWEGTGFTLQTSTNVLGPWDAALNQANPQTLSMTNTETARFFRLRR